MGAMQSLALAHGSVAQPAASRAARPEPPAPEPVRVPPEPAPARRMPGEGYRSPGPSPTVLAAIVGLHIAMIGALATMHFAGEERAERDRLATFSVAAAAPPEPLPPEPLPPETLPQPAEPAPARQAAAAPLLAPQSPLSLPRRVEIAASPPGPVVAPSAPPAPALAAAAPQAQPAPAPVVPPDFSARQLDNPAPAYPYLSRRAREEGVAVLRVLVSRDGRALRLQIEESSGHRRLDDAALETVRGWRFIPASQAGEPREAWVLVPVTFDLG